MKAKKPAKFVRDTGVTLLVIYFSMVFLPLMALLKGEKHLLQIALALNCAFCATPASRFQKLRSHRPSPTIQV